MGNDGFFNWLGEAIGKVIRFIVDLLSTVLGGVWAAMDDFLRGLARAIGMDASLFSFVVLVIGLLLLFGGIRALLRKGIISGLILIFLGLVVMSWLIH